MCRPGPLPLAELSICCATTADESVLLEMPYQALYVPPGALPFARSVLESPNLTHDVAGFGTRPADIGFIAEPRTARPLVQSGLDSRLHSTAATATSTTRHPSCLSLSSKATEAAGSARRCSPG
jgi:hypothetical protein